MTTTTSKFYKISGEPVSQEIVHATKKYVAFAKRVGLWPHAVHPIVANRIDKMTDEEFCTYSGNFTFHQIKN